MRVTAVRPYRGDIRSKVFLALAEAGLKIQPEDVIPVGTLDSEIVSALRERRDHVLLVPFNAQQDREGNRTHGLNLLKQLAEQNGDDFPWTVIMPVSSFGKVAARSILGRVGPDAPNPAIQERTLIVEEQDLEDPELPWKIRNHVVARGARQ